MKRTDFLLSLNLKAFLLCTTPESGDGLIPAKALGEALRTLGHNPKSEEMDAFWSKKRVTMPRPTKIEPQKSY